MSKYDAAPMNYKVRLWFGIITGLCIGWFACYNLTKGQELPSVLPVVTDNGMLVEVVDVYDGDTFYINVEGWPDIVGKKIRVRVSGIDAPEIRGGTAETKKKGQASKNFLTDELMGKTTLYGGRHNKPKVYLKSIERGKYFRLVADVYYKPYNTYNVYNLGTVMLRENKAQKYVATASHLNKEDTAVAKDYEVTFKCQQPPCRHVWTEHHTSAPNGAWRRNKTTCPRCKYYGAKYVSYKGM